MSQRQATRGRWSVFAFKSDYDFDLATDGAGLTELLESFVPPSLAL